NVYWRGLCMRLFSIVDISGHLLIRIFSFFRLWLWSHKLAGCSWLAPLGRFNASAHSYQQYTLWPEQTAYELLRPVVLFGDPAIGRAKETGEPRTSLERKADDFDEQGMVSLFASRTRKQPQETARSLPPDMRQLIVDLRVELPSISLREIA